MRSITFSTVSLALNMASLEFEICCGVVDCGWSDFSVRIGNQSWQCNASYISNHPLSPLIHSAVDLYSHIFEQPLPTENATWDSLAADQPGGILIRATPVDRDVRVRVFHYLGEPAWPNPEVAPDVAAVGDEVIDYWTYAEAVVDAAARSIVRQGFSGFRHGWEPRNWDADGHEEVLPVERFFYLAALTKHRHPKKEIGFCEELSLMHEFQEKYKS